MFVRLVVAVGIVAVSALGACSDDDVAGGRSATGSHAVHVDDGWKLQEAVDPAADDPLTSNSRPALDWYAEYVRSEHTEMVRLSGHEADLDEARAELEALGFEFGPVRVDGHDEALVGAHPRDEAGPDVLLVASGGRTLMALSYDVEREVLVEFMRSVEVTGRADWVASGGVIR